MSLKTLVLAEKPSQARDYAKGLGERTDRKDGYMEGGQYVFSWAVGHLVELHDPDHYNHAFKKWAYNDLPIIPEQFEYRITKTGEKQFRVLEKLLKRKDIDKVIIATDPGREGELIARLILKQAGSSLPTHRLWVQSLTPDIVREAFKKIKPAEEYDRLYHSALARQHSDWLIGMNASRAFTTMLGPTLSLGRVQTPVLWMIAHRDKTIKTFTPEDYWTIKAAFNYEGQEYLGDWIGEGEIDQEVESEQGAEEEKGEKKEKSSGTRIKSAEKAREIEQRIQNGDGFIESAEKKLKKEGPPLLFSLTTLQREANKRFGFSADRTLKLAQSLYEEKKALSYPRSEAQHLDGEMADQVKQIVDGLASREEVGFDLDKCTVAASNKRIFDASKLTDHHALIPTGIVEGDLTADEAKLYELVVRRFVAAFYPWHEYEQTKIITVVGQDKFRTVGRITKVVGWKEIFSAQKAQKQEEGEQTLPALVRGDCSKVVKVVLEEKQTKPPSHYNDASLLGDMENPRKFVTDSQLKKILKETSGLGTVATRAEIFKTLEKRGYIKREGKQIKVTPKGKALIDIIENDPIADPGYTAVWEQYLDAIASGKQPSADPFMEKIKAYTIAIVKKAGTLKVEETGFANIAKENEARQVVVGPCPECGNDMVGRPKSYSCSNYPTCKTAIWKDTFKRFGKKILTPSQTKSLLAGKSIELKGLVSKAGKKFDAKAKLEKHEKYGWQPGLIFDQKK